MLRRKLMVLVGVVVTLLMLAGVGSIMTLQSVLVEMEHVAAQAIVGTNACTAIQLRVAELQAMAGQVNPSATNPITDPPARMVQVTKQIVEHADQIGRLDAIRAGAGPPHQELQAILSHLQELVDQTINTARIDLPTNLINAASNQLSSKLARLDSALHAHVEHAQQAATSRFRIVAIGVGLVFVIIINALILISGRFSGLILEPMDRLVEASRHLAREEFGYRVDMNRSDEFGEVARAYNAMAEQLQANEQRKIETLHQVARTLSHELNNAISIIQSQLDLVARSTGPDRIQAQRLSEIQQAMARMSALIADLTRIRRIVLTDYLSGVKMLDIPRSVEEEPAAA